MARFERNIDLGLSTEQSTLITTPIRDLTLEEAKTALVISDHRAELVGVINHDYTPDRANTFQILSKDSFQSFQSPADTNVIITNERERQDDMKRHGCFDARELIPHGKTSLLDAKL